MRQIAAKKKMKIMLVSGEPSGDQLGAKLVDSLRNSAGERSFEFFGSAGVKMRQAGVEAVVDADGLAIMGVLEVARALPTFLKAFRALRDAARTRKPDVVVLIDFPDFNLKLARSMKRQGRRVVYYVSPQLWGWRKNRLKTIRDHVDLLLAILPFEEEWYADHGVENVKYVGHPLAGNVGPSMTGPEFRKLYSIDADRPLVALLPGSRLKELSRILPPMVQAAAILREEIPDIQFAVALAATRSEAEVQQAIELAGTSVPGPLPEIKVVIGATYDLMNAADAAAVASGTATLEAGIIGVPMAIVYKTSGLNARLFRPLISVEHFGLINLIAGKRVAAELIQEDFTPEALAGEIRRLLDPSVNASMRAELGAAADKLGDADASGRAAEAIIHLMSQAD